MENNTVNDLLSNKEINNTINNLNKDDISDLKASVSNMDPEKMSQCMDQVKQMMQSGKMDSLLKNIKINNLKKKKKSLHEDNRANRKRDQLRRKLKERNLQKSIKKNQALIDRGEFKIEKLDKYGNKMELSENKIDKKVNDTNEKTDDNNSEEIDILPTPSLNN